MKTRPAATCLGLLLILTLCFSTVLGQNGNKKSSKPKKPIREICISFDELPAAGGVLFTQFYVCSGVCSPSRASAT